jgi:hypothetical protein
MKERGRYQIQFMKTRSSSGVGQKVDLEFNIDTLRISDLGEEEESSFAQQKTSTQTSNIMSSFKKTSTVKESSTERSQDPNDGIAVPKVKAITDGAKLVISVATKL